MTMRAADSRGVEIPNLLGAQLTSFHVFKRSILVNVSYQPLRDDERKVNLKLRFSGCNFLYALSEGVKDQFDPMYLDGLYSFETYRDLGGADEHAKRHLRNIWESVREYFVEGAALSYFAPITGTAVVIVHKELIRED
jgi:hypothetical protein